MVECDRLHGLCVPFERLLQFARFPVPYFDRRVVARCRQLAKLGMERDVGHHLPVADQDVPRGVPGVPVLDGRTSPCTRCCIQLLLELPHLVFELHILHKPRDVPFSGGGSC